MKHRMSNLLFSLNIVLPMIILIALGYLFRYFAFVSDEFVQIGKKLCFYVFLPCNLFKNLYDSALDDVPYGLIFFALLWVLIIFVLSFLITRKVPSNKRGVMIQGMIRSNYAYIGIPLASQMFVDEVLIGRATTYVSLLSIFILPLFSVLSVVALSMFGEDSNRTSIKATIKNTIRNPIIIGIILGVMVLFIRELIPDSAYFLQDKLAFVYKALSYLSQLATPFSLLMVGADLHFDFAKDLKNVMTAIAFKMVIYPALILFVAYKLKSFDGPMMATLVSAFASPTAVSSAIMASQMKGDGDLANSIVVFSTIFSSISLIMIIFVLKSVGCI